MTYPNYPPQQPQYPPQQGYPPQYPPQQPVYPPQQPQYPPQYQAPPPPPPQQPRGSIDDFYDQPAASGKSIAAWFQTPGQSISGVIARAITDADTRPQTDMQTKQPRYFSDGRPMLTMTIPLLVAPQPDFPDGRAAWIIGSSDREDLDMAMQQAGCKPRTVPEAGAVVTVTFTGLKQIPGFGAPKKVKRITYQRPPNANGNGNGQATTQAISTALQNAQPQQPYVPAPSPAPAPAHQESFGAPEGLGYNPGSGYTQYAPPQAPPPGYQQPPPVPQPTYQQDPYATATGQPQQPPPPPQAPPQGPPPQQPQFATPAELTPEQAERLRQLTGGQ